MASRGQQAAEPARWIQAVRRVPGADKSVNMPGPSTSKVASLRNAVVNLSKARLTYVTPQPGPSSRPRQQQAQLRAYFPSGTTAHAWPREKPQMAPDPPPRQQVGRVGSGKAAALLKAYERPITGGTSTGWGNLEDGMLVQEDLGRPAKRLRRSPPLLKKSPRQSLSAHEAALQAGLRRSASPAPQRKFAEAEPESVVPNPFEDEVFSQLPFEEQTIDLALWARLADMDAPPPARSPPRPRSRATTTSLQSASAAIESPPTRMSPQKGPPSPPSERNPGSSQTLSECDISLHRQSSPSQTQHSESWALYLPDDTHQAHERSIALEQASRVTPAQPSHGKEDSLATLEDSLDVNDGSPDPRNAKKEMSTQTEGPFRFAILPNTPDRLSSALSCSAQPSVPHDHLSWNLGDEGDHSSRHGQILVAETQHDDSLGSAQCESSHWQRNKSAFTGAHPTKASGNTRLSQTSLSAFFKPDTCSKEELHAIAAVRAVRASYQVGRRSSGKTSSVRSSVSPTKSELSDELEEASPPLRAESGPVPWDAGVTVASSQHADDMHGYGDSLFDQSMPSLSGESIRTEMLYAGGVNTIQGDGQHLPRTLVDFFQAVENDDFHEK